MRLKILQLFMNPTHIKHEYIIFEGYIVQKLVQLLQARILNQAGELTIEYNISVSSD